MKRLMLFTAIFLFICHEGLNFSHSFKLDRQMYADVVKAKEKHNKLMDLWYRVSMVESNNGINTFNEKENAIGIVQIRPIMIKEVNQIYGYDKYKHSQSWDNETSFSIFKDFQDKFNPDYDLERGARMWNGGRSGMNKTATISYYKKVLNVKIN